MKNRKILLVLIALSTLVMSIGYAKISSMSMGVNGEFLANAESGLFISEATILGSNDDSLKSSSVITYNKLMFKSKTTLINSDSYVSYKITFYNNSGRDYEYVNTTYDTDNSEYYTNQNIEYTISGIEVGDKVAPKNSISLVITFKYKDINNITDNSLTSYLKFVFNKGFTIMEKELISKYAPDGNEENITDINNLSETDRKNMFSNIEENNGGIYKTSGIDGNDIYFLRGVINNNYVNLGGYLFRILQIDEDGNLRLILDSTVNINSKYNSSSEVSDIANISDILGYENSLVKNVNDNWITYIKELYPNRVITSTFCQDYSYEEHKNNSTSTDVGYFKSYINVGRDVGNYSPSLACDEKYRLTSDIGLISAEELVLAGASFEKTNSKFFIYNNDLNKGNVNEYFWTLSPAFYDFTRGNGGVFLMGYDGKLSDWIGGLGTNNFGVRPVITVDGNYKMLGDGTKSNPYYYSDYKYTTASLVNITSYDELDNKKFFIANLYGKYNRNGILSSNPNNIGLYGIDTAKISEKKDVLTNVSAEVLTFENKGVISDDVTDGYKYQIKTLDGKYLKINDDLVIEFTSEEVYLKVMIGKEFTLDGETVSYPGRIVISNLAETVYLNFYGAESSPLKDMFAGWNELDKNAYMSLYSLVS